MSSGYDLPKLAETSDQKRLFFILPCACEGNDQHESDDDHRRAYQHHAAELHARMSEPGFYQQARELITQAPAEEERLQNELAALYERWEELDCLQG